MSEINILKNILQTIPNMDAENISSIIKSYTDVDYYNRNNIPLHLQIEYTVCGWGNEINIMFVQNKFFIVENICFNEHNTKRICVKDGKYFKHTNITQKCNCPMHINENNDKKNHMNFEEYELKSKDEGYFYVECDHVFSTTKAYGFDKQVYEHKILSEISLEDIKKTIHLFEDWYVAYKNSEIANDDDDLDSDNFDRNRVIHFKTIVLPCHDMDSDKLCNLFEQVYDKFYKIK